MHLRLGSELEAAVELAWARERDFSGELAKASFVRRLIWLGLRHQAEVSRSESRSTSPE